MARVSRKVGMGFVGLVTILATLLASAANAAEPLKAASPVPTMIRWTAAEDTDGSFDHILKVLNRKTGQAYQPKDFGPSESRDLAFNHYRRFVQMLDGAPIRDRSIRVWTELGSDKVIQVEANLEPKRRLKRMLDRQQRDQLASGFELSTESALEIARLAVTSDRDGSGDTQIRGIESHDEWRDGILVRAVRIRAKRGVHHVAVRLTNGAIVSSEYREFPQAELRAQVYPIYEEAEGQSGGSQVLPRIPVVLKNILSTVPQTDGDIYAPLKAQRYLESMLDPVLGSTPEGRARGFWSMAYVKEQAAQLRAALPQRANSFANGLLLQGKFATINIHPDAAAKYGPWGFEAQRSAPLLANWRPTTFQGKTVYEMVPGTAYAGKPIFSEQDAWDRPARRLADHDPQAYLGDGFDEIQVYYAVDTLFEELQARGWKDPELSTRAFNAFLYDPDISMRDNAYYTDDTINFTTYSPDAQNFARDNSTIWHELGHGVMDRMMGDSIELADTGGLSEGMADFVAALVVEAVTQGASFPGREGFRINNSMGFYLTNEVHDDGEAYGGAMKDFLDAAIARDGQAGLHKVTDVVLEGMRLSRDYPGLTAPEWFRHVLFADQLGRPGLRAPGELGGLLLSALARRNFKMDGGPTASFAVVNALSDVPIEAGNLGSREKPIITELPKDGMAAFSIEASLKSSDQYAFKYPVTLEVQFRGGPLQGAVHWEGEEAGSKTYVLRSEQDRILIPLRVSGTCDQSNLEDGSCKDFAYLKVFNAGESRAPAAKKRFYVRVKN